MKRIFCSQSAWRNARRADVRAACDEERRANTPRERFERLFRKGGAK